MEWEAYKIALTEYNKEVRRSKRMDWRRTCESIEKTPVVARLQKALSNDHVNGLGTVKRQNDCLTSNGIETLEVMMQTHFPCSTFIYKSDGNVAGDTTSDEESRMTPLQETTVENSNINLHSALCTAWKKADEIFTKTKVEWAISSFNPFKSPGRDGIYPAFLQKSGGLFTSCLSNMFKASLTLGYIPKSWRQVRVVFIPKANKKDKTSPKSFRPISLSSIMLKIMEKLIDYYIKSTYLKQNPINNSQFAYQTGKSTVTALHTLCWRGIY